MVDSVMNRKLLLIAALATSSVVYADEATPAPAPVAQAPAEPTIAWHVGLDVRTDLGTHPVRVPFGFRRDDWDATIVLDPYAFLDGEHDLDVLAEWYVGPRVGLLAG